jgi:hypothetical protein
MGIKNLPCEYGKKYEIFRSGRGEMWRMTETGMEY